MKVDAPVLYKAVTATFVYPRFVRRAMCPKCSTIKPREFVGELHRHGRHGKASAFVPRMVRVPLYPVAPGSIEDASAWFEERWRGGVFVPDELLPLASVA